MAGSKTINRIKSTKGELKPKVAVQPKETTEGLLTDYLRYLQGPGRVAVTTWNTRRYELNDFMKAMDFMPIEELTLQDIDEYLANLSDRAKPSTVNQYKQTLRLFFEYCQARRKIQLEFDYTMLRRTRERPVKVDIIPRGQVEYVVNNCKENQDALMIAVLYETGIRIGELCNLQVEDIRDTEIRVRGKGEKDRVVIMPHALASALRNYLIEQHRFRGYVFKPLQEHSNHTNYKYAVAGCRVRIQQAFMKCGIKMHPHQLRHSFAFNWLKAGGDIRTLQKLLGHDSLETTQRYLNITDSHLKDDYHSRMRKCVLGIWAISVLTISVNWGTLSVVL